MPDKKITDLVDGDPLQSTDEFVVARAGDNFKIDGAAVVAAVTKHDVTISGNTAGALAAISSGTMTLAGGNNITLSQAGNAVTISGPNVGGAQTGISGIANSETTYTSGTVSLSELGAITIRSTTGQQFQFSVNPQSVQPETQTFVGGISASDTLYTSGTVRFTGSQAITVRSGTGQLVVIDAPVQSVQPETQTFVGGISASDTLYTSGTVRFTGVGGGVTVSSNTGQRVDISVAAQSVQPETQTFIGGISASDTLYTSGTVRFTGVGGGITVSTNTGQRVDLSVAAQSVQPETQTFVAGIGNSQTTYTSGTVNLSVVAGQLTIRSTTGQAFQFSASQSVQPETQTAISGIANSQTTYTSGTVSLSELGAITIRSTTGNQFQFSVNAQTNQTGISGIANSQTTYTSGTVSLSELGAITIRSTTGNQYQLSVNAQTVQTQGILSAGVSTGGNTVGNTQVSTGSRFVIVASGNATASQATAAGASTVTISVGAQTTQTQGILSAGVSTGGNTLGNTTVNTGSRLVFVGSGNLTASQGTAAGASTITLSVAAQTVQTQGVLSAGVSNIGNSSGDTTVNTGSRFVLAGGNNITLSQSTAAGATTVTISAGAGGAGLSAGMSTNGNTSGDTGFASQRLALIGGNNITLSGSTNGGSMSITVSAPNLGAGAMSAGASNLGNTAGSTGITGTQLVLVGSGPISLSQSTGANGGTLSINAPATSSLSATGGIQISTNGSTISIGDGGRTMANWENMPAMQAVLYTHISGVSKTPFYWIENLPQGIKPANIAMRVSMVTASQPLSLSIHFGVYTFVNSTSVALLGSGSDAFVVSSASSVSFSAQRNLVLTSPGTATAISSLSAGNYLFGCMFSATATNAMNASIYAASAAAGPRLGLILPGTNQLSTATSQGIAGLYGRGSTTVNAMPANVVASEVVNQGIGASSPMKPYIFIRS